MNVNSAKPSSSWLSNDKVFTIKQSPRSKASSNGPEIGESRTVGILLFGWLRLLVSCALVRLVAGRSPGPIYNFAANLLEIGLTKSIQVHYYASQVAVIWLKSRQVKGQLGLTWLVGSAAAQPPRQAWSRGQRACH